MTTPVAGSTVATAVLLDNQFFVPISVVEAVLVVVSPICRTVVDVPNPEIDAPIVMLFSSYTTISWLSIRAFTMQAAFTAHGDPSADKLSFFTYFPIYIIYHDVTCEYTFLKILIKKKSYAKFHIGLPSNSLH